MFAASAHRGRRWRTSFATLIVARLLSGLGVGAVLVAAPMYIAEISPPALRGRMVTFNQLFIVSGIFLASASNLLILQLEDFQFDWFRGLHVADSNWRWMLGIGVAASRSLFICIVVRSGKSALARHARTARRGAPRPRARARRCSLPNASSGKSVPRWRTTRGTERSPRCAKFGRRSCAACLFIGLVVGILQQITGINSVLSYAVDDLRARRRRGADDARSCRHVFVGLVNVVFTVFALLLIDRVGRRPLADVRLRWHRRLHAAAA